MKNTLTVLALICVASSALAQTPFTGTYTWGANGNTNSFAYNGTDIANLTESAFTKTANVGTSSSSGNFRATNWALDLVTNSLTGTNDPTKYFEFSLTAASGFTLSMTNINFGIGRSGTGARTFAWASSVDSFAAIITNYSSLGSSGQFTNNNGAVSFITDSTSTTATNVVLDLSGASFQSLTSITFRFYGWNAEQTTGTAGLQGPLSFSGSLLNTNPVTGGTYWAADPAGGGSGTWIPAGTTWATNSGGAGAGQTQSSSTLNFADTAGTVTVSGGVSVSNGMTFQTTGYQVQSSSVTLAGTSIANNAITTDPDVTTTISSELAGTAGMTKSGSGTLVLAGSNSFSGNVSVAAGTLQITNDSALGNTANDLANNGTLKTTTDISLAAGRDLSGNGTYDIADGTTLTVNGNANNTATTLGNSGTLDLQGATRSLGATTIAAPGTLDAAGAVNVTTLTTSGLTNGTATINPDIVFTSGVKTLNVAAGGELALNGAVSGATTIAKTGAGTLSINNSNSVQIRVGATAASPTDGGTVVVASAASMGSGQIQLNYGTLRAASAIVATNGLSIGGRTGTSAVLDGSDVEFQGQSSFFRGTSTSGEMDLTVNNSATFSGGFAAISGSGAATGITIRGSGAVTISGVSSALVENITLAETITLTLNQTIGGGVSIGNGVAATLGGSGGLLGSLFLGSDAKFIFDLNNTGLNALTVGDADTDTVSFGAGFGIDSLVGLDSSVANGTYTIIDGPATFDFANVSNLGSNNAVSLGDGKFAYFSEGSLQVNVVPEPSTYAMLALAGAGFAGYVIRRRRR
jgi:fibronectin-binding autotransporter adhesin